MPEQPPETALVGEIESPEEQFVEESIEGGFLGQSAEIRAGAVFAGGEGRRRRGTGLGVGAWLAIGWMVFIVLVAVLAKTGILTWGDAEESFGRVRAQGPVRRRGQVPRASCSGATATAAT